MNNYYVHVQNGTLFCRSEGDGRPLLLIHGAGVDSDFFEEAALALAQRYKVITYDRRGYSRSVCTISGAYFAQQAEDAAAVIKSMCGEEKIVVVGCSAGATIALHLAACYPELIGCLVLHEPVTVSCFPPGNRFTEAAVSIWNLISQNKVYGAMYQFLSCFSGGYSTPSDLPSNQLDKTEKNLSFFLKEEFYHIFFDVLPLIDTRLFQVLVCLGEDHLNDYFSYASAQISEFYNVRQTRFPGGHNCAKDQPEEFAKYIELSIK